MRYKGQRCHVRYIETYLRMELNVVPSSNLPGLRFVAYFIRIMMWHSDLHDMELEETNGFIL